jgi:hypothetical protein
MINDNYIKSDITIKLVRSSKVNYIKNFNFSIHKTIYIKSLGKSVVGNVKNYHANICSKKQYSWLWWTLEIEQIYNELYL